MFATISACSNACAHELIVDRYDPFLLDLDGVVVLGDRAAPGATEALAQLRRAGKHPAFITNNSSRTPRSIVERLHDLGIDVRESEIETSALTTADALGARGVERVYVIGGTGLTEALRDRRIRVVGDATSPVDAVVIGWDPTVDYAKLRDASTLIQRGADLFATNADASLPTSEGERWPGAGALVAAVETTTGVKAEVMGKPAPAIFRAALSKVGGDRPLVIGDRVDTDIAGAAALGWDSLLVLTGISAGGTEKARDPAPTFIGADLRVLFDPTAG
jgi:glycerol 3-phosphatase-2